MGTDERTRAEVRTAMRELGRLLAEWDPAGLISAGPPADEYECLVGPLLTRLSKAPSLLELTAWLRDRVTDHFGSCKNPEPFARRVTEWYRVAERRTG